MLKSRSPHLLSETECITFQSQNHTFNTLQAVKVIERRAGTYVLKMYISATELIKTAKLVYTKRLWIMLESLIQAGTLVPPLVQAQT